MRLANATPGDRFALLRTLAVVGELSRRGCRVRDASAHTAVPVVRIDPPPPGLFATYGFLPPPAGCVRVPVLCAAHRWRTRIEWISQEPNQ